MKKFLAILSLVSFVAVNVSFATEPVSSDKETKKETTVAKSDAKAGGHGCCKMSGMKASSDKMKNCTAAEKAACSKSEKAKMGCDYGDKSKAEAKSGSETEVKESPKANNN